jgi:hypothetical protein
MTVRNLAKSRAVRTTIGLAAAATAGAVVKARHGRRSAEPGGDSHPVEAYCVRERKKVPIKDPVETVMKNGKPAVRGTCPDCGAKLFRMGALPA